MSLISKKILISLVTGVVFFVALMWLLFRLLSGPLGPGVHTYHIGRDSTWYPMDLRGKEKNLVGFSNDLLQVIAQEQGFKVNLFEVGPNALFDGLQIGNYEGILSSLTPNAMNKKKYGFSDPYYLIGPVLMVSTNSSAHSLQEMDGKIIGIESRSQQNFEIPEVPNVVMIPYPTAAEALENLDNNLIDGVILDALRAHVYADGFYRGRLKVVTSPLTDRGVRLLTLNETDKLAWIKQFNEGLISVKNKGIYDQLMNKWDLIHTEKLSSDPTFPSKSKG